MSRRPTAAVVVVGDIGRSPRMCNHALSLAQQMDYNVFLIGQTETAPNSLIANHPNIRLIGVDPPPVVISEFLPQLLALPLRFLWTALMLFSAFFFRLGWHLDFILVQNPPGLPVLCIAIIAAWIRRARLIVDWHNYTWSMLAQRWNLEDVMAEGRREEREHTSQPRSRVHSGANERRAAPSLATATNGNAAVKKLKKPKSNKQKFLEWTHWLEGWCGRRVHASICVSKAMREDLAYRWGVPSAVFYDRPPSWKFKHPSLSDLHSLFVQLGTKGDGLVFRGEEPTKEEKDEANANGEGDLTQFTLLTLQSESVTIRLRRNRPLILLSSTSWTPDEDFSILLDALTKYDEIARVSHNSTPEHSLPRLLVVITGRGPDKAFYQSKISRLSLAWVDICTPWLKADDYPRMLAAADIGVSLHTSTSGLDLPMKVIDMFGVGLPVLAKRFACIGELVEDGRNGLLFDSSHQLSQHIITLATGHPTHNKALQELREGASGCLPSWEETWSTCVKALFEQVSNEPLQRILARE